MGEYIGLDVSLEETHVCVVGQDGSVVGRANARTDPSALAKLIVRLAPAPERVVLETGAQSAWLHDGLAGHGLPVVIVDARQAKAVLSCRLNKTDINDAEGLAQLARTGWYRKVLAKRPATRRVRAVLSARAQLVRQRRDLTNQMRAILRGFGLALGRATHRMLASRVHALCEREPGLAPALAGLLKVHGVLCAEIAALDERRWPMPARMRAGS